MGNNRSVKKNNKKTVVNDEPVETNNLEELQHLIAKAILEAEGQAEAIRRVADAQKYEIATVYSAIHQGNPTNDLLAVKYMETLGKVADGKASKIFLPLETSGVMGSIAGIAELFKDKKEENKK